MTVWMDADRPVSGSEYICHQEVRKRVRLCAASTERKRTQHREMIFRSGENYHFKKPQKKKYACSKLVVDGIIVQEEDALMGI